MEKLANHKDQKKTTTYTSNGGNGGHRYGKNLARKWKEIARPTNNYFIKYLKTSRMSIEA